MPLPPVASEIHAARCTVCDLGTFLRDLRALATANDTRIICFNADLIAGRAHAALAVAQAVRAFEEGGAISNTLEMEALLYASGSRQCNTAATFGIHDGGNRLYICCYPARDDIWARLGDLFRFVDENWDLIDPDKRRLLMEIFAITPEEIAAAGGDGRIVDLVLERVALLQVMR